MIFLEWLAGVIALGLMVFFAWWFVGHFFKVMRLIHPYYARHKIIYDVKVKRVKQRQRSIYQHDHHSSSGSSLDPIEEEDEDD